MRLQTGLWHSDVPAWSWSWFLILVRIADFIALTRFLVAVIEGFYFQQYCVTTYPPIAISVNPNNAKNTLHTDGSAYFSVAYDIPIPAAIKSVHAQPARFPSFINFIWPLPGW